MLLFCNCFLNPQSLHNQKELPFVFLEPVINKLVLEKYSVNIPFRTEIFPDIIALFSRSVSLEIRQSFRCRIYLYRGSKTSSRRHLST